MIPNITNKTVDIEQRDVNYILSAYLRAYFYYSKNEDPECIIFPMFDKVPHPTKVGEFIPVKFLPPIDPMVTEIIDEGSNVPEATQEELEVRDQMDQIADELQGETITVDSAITVDTTDADVPVTHSEELPIADAIVQAVTELPVDPNRVPKQPANPIPPGISLDDMKPRNEKEKLIFERNVARDLRPDKNIDESKEVEFGKSVSKDADGNIVVEE